MKITCPDLYIEFSTGNFVGQISNREFSRIHYDQAHEQCNKEIKSISGPINFVNRSDESLQRRWEIAGPEIAEYLQYVEENIFKSENSDKVFSHHENNPSHDRMFLKDYAIITARLKAVDPFMEKAFVKAGTSCKYNNNVHAFVKSIPDIGQTKYEEFVENRLIKGKLRVSDTIKKKNFETPSTKQKKTPGKKIIALTEAVFNKLRSTISSRPRQCEALFASEFTFYPESLTKNQEMYHGNKSIALDIYEPNPSYIQTIKHNATIIDLSAIIRSQAGVSTAETFTDSVHEVISNGFGKNRKYYNINTISLHLSDEQRSALLFFYIFTGSDVTSSFFNLSKKLWWKVWSENTFVSQTFISLSWTPNDITEMDYLKIEKLVCTAYDPQKRFLTDDVNRLRYLLFSMSTDNNLRKLPPSRAALKQHILRSAYAAGWIWGGCLNNRISIPHPTEWGWKSDDDNKIVPNWCPVIEVDLNELLYTCCCKKECIRCKCATRGELCLPFCKCPCNTHS